MNNQKKFTTQSSKLKGHRANSQTISSNPIRFSTDFLFSPLVSFAFFIIYLLAFFVCLFVCLFVCFWLKIYILIHIQLCGRVTDKKIFSRPISGNKTSFFWPKRQTADIFKRVYLFIYSFTMRDTCSLIL